MAGHTTLRLTDALLRRAKAYARREGTTLAAVMERALTAYLNGASSDDEPRAVRVPSFGRGGVRHGVNLNRAGALLDLMDGVEAADSDKA